MHEITEHVPAFVETRGALAPRAQFATIAELEAIPFVARWKSSPAFTRFSKSRHWLMAEFGATEKAPAGSFHVVGYLHDPGAVDLPEWVAPK